MSGHLEIRGGCRYSADAICRPCKQCLRCEDCGEIRSEEPTERTLTRLEQMLNRAEKIMRDLKMEGTK